MNWQAILGWVVLIGLVWFVLRRGVQGGGCCGGHGDHAGHGDQGDHAGHSDEGGQASHHAGPAGGGETAVDPVCGMTVQKSKALRATVDGVEYYFCNEACRKEFTGRQQHGGTTGCH